MANKLAGLQQLFSKAGLPGVQQPMLSLAMTARTLNFWPNGSRSKRAKVASKGAYSSGWVIMRTHSVGGGPD